MDIEQIEHIACSVEAIANGRLERVVRLIKILEKADETSTKMHLEDLLNEVDNLKFELKTILNFMESVK